MQSPMRFSQKNIIIISTDDPYLDTKVVEVRAARAETFSFSLAKSYSACAIHPVSLEYP